MRRFESDSHIDGRGLARLLANLSCPICEATRDTSLRVAIVGPPAGATLRAECVNCHLLWSFALEGANRVLETPTARPTPAGPATPAGPITADEILELHRQLEGLDGPFTDLLWKRVSR